MLNQPAPAPTSDESTPVAVASTPMAEIDPGLVMTCCANCGKQMIDRKCKMICECGYFLSCSDYY
jgi:exosome complex RNA-binding protein Csl4